MTEQGFLIKKVAKLKKITLTVILVISISLWVTISCISIKYFFIDTNFIGILLSVEGTLFSIITAAYIFYIDFLVKEITRTFQTRNKLFTIYNNDEDKKNHIKKGLSDQFLHLVFLQYLLAFALFLISVSLIFSIIIIVSIKGIDTGILGIINLCFLLWGIVLIIIWLLIMGFGNLPSKESYRALIED